MNHETAVRLTISPVEDRPGHYLAWCRSVLYNAVFSVCFRDDLYGACALDEFAEIIRRKYHVPQVVFEHSGEPLAFECSAVTDVLSNRCAAEPVPSAAA